MAKLPTHPFESAEVQASWEAELERRAADILADPDGYDSEPWDEVHAELQAMLTQKKSA